MHSWHTTMTPQSTYQNSMQLLFTRRGWSKLSRKDHTGMRLVISACIPIHPIYISSHVAGVLYTFQKDGESSTSTWACGLLTMPNRILFRSQNQEQMVGRSVHFLSVSWYCGIRKPASWLMFTLVCQKCDRNFSLQILTIYPIIGGILCSSTHVSCPLSKLGDMAAGHCHTKTMMIHFVTESENVIMLRLWV